jgi:hypothetical protein
MTPNHRQQELTCRKIPLIIARFANITSLQRLPPFAPLHHLASKSWPKKPPSTNGPNASYPQPKCFFALLFKHPFLSQKTHMTNICSQSASRNFAMLEPVSTMRIPQPRSSALAFPRILSCISSLTNIQTTVFYT